MFNIVSPCFGIVNTVNTKFIYLHKVQLKFNILSELFFKGNIRTNVKDVCRSQQNFGKTARADKMIQQLGELGFNMPARLDLKV